MRVTIFVRDAKVAGATVVALCLAWCAESCSSAASRPSPSAGQSVLPATPCPSVATGTVSATNRVGRRTPGGREVWASTLPHGTAVGEVLSPDGTKLFVRETRTISSRRWPIAPRPARSCGRGPIGLGAPVRVRGCDRGELGRGAGLRDRQHQEEERRGRSVGHSRLRRGHRQAVVGEPPAGRILRPAGREPGRHDCVRSGQRKGLGPHRGDRLRCRDRDDAVAAPLHQGACRRRVHCRQPGRYNDLHLWRRRRSVAPAIGARTRHPSSSSHSKRPPAR